MDVEGDAVLQDGTVVLCIRPGERQCARVANAVVPGWAASPVGKAALALAAREGVSLAQVHAPHAVEIGGVQYRGGEFSGGDAQRDGRSGGAEAAAQDDSVAGEVGVGPPRD